MTLHNIIKVQGSKDAEDGKLQPFVYAFIDHVELSLKDRFI